MSAGVWDEEEVQGRTEQAHCHRWKSRQSIESLLLLYFAGFWRKGPSQLDKDGVTARCC